MRWEEKQLWKSAGIGVQSMFRDGDRWVMYYTATARNVKSRVSAV